MKTTMQAAAVAVLGMALAAPAWGHSEAAFFQSFRYPKRPDAFQDYSGIRVFARMDHDEVPRPSVGFPGPFFRVGAGDCPAAPTLPGPLGGRSYCHLYVYQQGSRGERDWFRTTRQLEPTFNRLSHGGYGEDVVVALVGESYYPRPDGQHWGRYVHGVRHIHFRVHREGEPVPPPPPEPETPPPPPEPETPTPPEPETPTPPEPEPPEPVRPEPETPEPPEPDHTHPVERCDHLAIVPSMPRALAGEEGSPDHWLHIVNPGPAGITFAVTGRDESGAKGGTYRRELPAYRGVRVLMRDLEAAFDVAKPAGWWRLVVTGSGPVSVGATMKQGDTRRFVPVRTPATCGTGPVTRTD